MEEKIINFLETTTPQFHRYLSMLPKDVSKWFQFIKAEVIDRDIIIYFKSSQNSLSFSITCRNFTGLENDYIVDYIGAYYIEVYNFYRDDKYKHIK